jgi:hypothetical protein
LYSEYPISAKPTEAPKTLNAVPGALAAWNPYEANEAQEAIATPKATQPDLEILFLRSHSH